MGQVLHGSATTTEAIRRAILNSQESLRQLARRHGASTRRPLPSGRIGRRLPICALGGPATNSRADRWPKSWLAATPPDGSALNQAVSASYGERAWTSHRLDETTSS